MDRTRAPSTPKCVIRVDRACSAPIDDTPHARGREIVLTSGDGLVLLAGSTVAGAVNAVAGGGSLLTFPLLVWLGREPILANATNTVSLSPGSIAALHGFRHELRGMRDWIVRGTLPSLAGGIVGAWLLLRTPSPVFAWLVPYLILFATVLFALSTPLDALARRRAPARKAARANTSVLVYQFLVSVYGGYFGAGIGIMMLAGLALSGLTAIHRAIAVRNYYAILINGVAALYFIWLGAVAWQDAAVLTVGQIAGGLVGARVARGLPAGTVRGFVVAVGMTMAAALLLRGR
jgi:uncharacterized protein